MSEETLKVSVEDSVSSKDSIGDAPQTMREATMQNNVNLREMAMQYLSRYVKPHNKPSRQVTQDDLERVLTEGEVMFNLCRIPIGGTTGAEAIAHMQIDDKEPLAFFVNKVGEFILNPKVVNHTRHYVDSTEGCMSFPGEPSKTVQRFNKIEVEFQTLLPGENMEDKPTLSPVMRINVTGPAAKVFQHECAHINGWNIYDEDFVPEACMTFRPDIDKKL